MNQSQFYKGAVNASDCISNGWSLVQQNYWLFFGISAVAWLILIAIAFILMCFPIINTLVQQAIAGPLFLGIYYTLLKQIRGEPTDFGMLFKGFNRFVPAMIVSLVAAAPIVIIQIIQLISNFANLGMSMMNNRNFQSSNGPALLGGGLAIVLLIALLVMVVVSFAVQISLFFALPLLADNENMNVMDAMKLSAKAAWANIGGLILLGILEILIMIAGAIVCGIGIFFVLPIIYAANAFAYRQVFPDVKQNFQNVPPPPTSYGNNYGFGQ